MSSPKKIKFAVVGCGHIGKRHAEMVSRNPDAELVALADTKPEHELALNNYGVPIFQSLEDLLAQNLDVDVICIATPNGLHSKMAITALEHKKHIVIEKPMGLSKANCEEVIFSALRNHKQVFCVMQNRYSPPSVWLKEMVEQNKLGEIHQVQINCYWNRDERYYTPNNWHGNLALDGGTLFTQFSHFIDIMYWLFGDVQNIQSRFADFNHQELTDFEDSGFINFEFVNGGIGSFNFSTAVQNQNLESSLTIIAEQGTIKVGGQYMNEISTCDIKDYTMPELAPVNPANDYGAYKGSAANHHYVIENVVKTLQGNDTTTTNALEGLKVVDIIERMYAAGKRPIKKVRS